MQTDPLVSDPGPAVQISRPLNKIVTVIAALVLGLINAATSLLAVALAIPGNGEIGSGFKVISLTFLIVNLISFSWALYVASRPVLLHQVLGFIFQLMTLPICLGVALLLMFLFGISDL